MPTRPPKLGLLWRYNPKTSPTPHDAPALQVYGQIMHLWAAAAWGLLGGLCVEALALHTTIRSTPQWNWRRPIPQGMPAYLISIVVRLGAGAALAAAAAGSGQVSGSFAAFGLGVAAPLIVQKLSQIIPLTGSLYSNDPERHSIEADPARQGPQQSISQAPQQPRSYQPVRPRNGR